MRRSRVMAFSFVGLGVCLLAGAVTQGGAQSRRLLNEELAFAILHGDAPRAGSLLEAGADPNAPADCDDRPRTFWEVVKGMFRRTPPRIKGAWFTAPIVKAVWVGNPEVIRLLLHYGANAETEDPVMARPILDQAKSLASSGGERMCGTAADAARQRGTDHKATLAVLQYHIALKKAFP